MNPLRKLASQTAIYGLSSVVGRFLNYLLVPFYTYVFAAEEYGIVTELYALAAFFNILYVYGLETTYFRFATKGTHGEDAVFNTAVTSILISSLIFSCSLWFFATPLVDFLEYPGKERFVHYFAAILAIDAILAIPFARLRLREKAFTFASAKIANILVTIGLNLLFLVWLKNLYEDDADATLLLLYNPDFSVEYVFISNLASNALVFLFLFKTISKVRLQVNKTLWKQLLTYSSPLLLMGLAGVTNEMLSRAMLKKLLPENFYQDYSNLAALGIFGACYKLSIFMNLAIQAFRFAAEPFFFSRSREENSPELFGQLMKWYVIFASFIFLAVSVNLNWLGPLILRREIYLEGLNVVPILLLANLFIGINFNLSIWYKLTDKTIYGAYIAATGALITIVFNILLIPIGGYLASSYVTLGSYFGMTILSYFLGQRFYPVPYSLGKIVFYILLALGLFLLCESWLLEQAGTLFAALFSLLTFSFVVFLSEHFKAVK